jgi:hypothetical protein
MKTETSTSASTKAPQKVSTAHRYQVLGFPAVRVIRTLGKNGFTFQEAKLALEKQGVTPAEATIRINLSIGHRTRKGSSSLAPLSDEQLADLLASVTPEPVKE